MTDESKTSGRPLVPTCTTCHEPADTCFPNACKAHLARLERERRVREFMQRESGYYGD